MLRDQKQAKNLLLLVVFVYTIVFLWHVFEDVYVTSIHRFYLVDGVDCTYEVGTIGIISVFQVRKKSTKNSTYLLNAKCILWYLLKIAALKYFSLLRCMSFWTLHLNFSFTFINTAELPT